jgi:Dyp-type peroxidase, C-terminal
MNNDARMLRRGYNSVDGSDGLGRLDAGPFFLAHQRDPHTQFVPVQNNLARSDVLNEDIRHVGSALFACPPGVRPAAGGARPCSPDPAAARPSWAVRTVTTCGYALVIAVTSGGIRRRSMHRRRHHD